MNDTERRMLRGIIAKRQEIAYNRLKSNLRYLEVCERQKKTDDTVDELLHRFEKEERISIRRHYEGETEKTNFELNEVYIQGLQDGIKILSLLGVFGAEVSL